MKLRTKTNIVVAAVLTCLSVIIYFSAHFILLKKFEAIENDRMKENIARAINAINADMESLDSHTKDWAWWNDAYSFMEDRHEAFITDNLMGASLASLGINGILFFTNEGQLVIERAIDLQNEQLVHPPPDVAADIKDNFTYFTPTDFSAGVRTIILPKGYPALICSRHILTSDRKGPSRGILVMTRNIDEARIQYWEKIVHLPITLFRTDDANAPADVRKALSSLSVPHSTKVMPIGGDKIAAYALMTDFQGKPAFVLKVSLPREIYNQASTAMSYFLVALFAVGLLFWFLSALLIDWTVIVRLLRLEWGVGDIASSGDHTGRVPVEGTDEISDLAVSINTMLAALEKSQSDVTLSESKYRTIFETTGAATSIVESDGTLSLVNAEFAELARVPKEEIEGKKKWTDFLRYKTGIRLTDIHCDASGETWPTEGNFIFVDAYGESHTVKSMVAEISGMNARVLSLADFTDYKKIQDALHESEGKYRTLVEQSHDAIFMLQGDMLIFANGKTSEMTGYSHDELLMRPIWDFIHPDDRERLREYAQRRMTNETVPDTYVARIVKKDGEVRHLECALQEVAYKGERVLLFTARDGTERQLAEEELRKANEELERVNKAKTDFTSIVSHELRTPLGTTKQAIEIMLEGIDGQVNEKQSERLSTAKRNVDRLIRLTNNVLDFARMETGRMEMLFEQTDVNQLMSEVQQLMKPAAEARKLKVLLELPQQVQIIKCDSDRIKQIVINLIDNAIKFTGEGGSVTLRLAGENGGIRIEVEDTGRGIKQEDLPKLFEPFRQIRTKGTRPVQGSGLGLFICKQIVELHGGEIEVASEYEEWTRFSIHLPAIPPLPG